MSPIKKDNDLIHDAVHLLLAPIFQFANRANRSMLYAIGFENHLEAVQIILQTRS